MSVGIRSSLTRTFFSMPSTGTRRSAARQSHGWRVCFRDMRPSDLLGLRCLRSFASQALRTVNSTIVGSMSSANTVPVTIRAAAMVNSP